MLGDRFFSFVLRKREAEWVGASKFHQIPSATRRLLLCQTGTAHPGPVHVATGFGLGSVHAARHSQP